MRYQNFARAAAGVLATVLLAAGAVVAQTRPGDPATTLAQGKQPEPATMVDTAPPPPQDRASLGAVILMDQPVLAQREALQQAQERSGIDTRAMGAGPNRIMRRALTRDEIEFQKAVEEAERQRGTPN
jgi:hypothetical protein